MRKMFEDLCTSDQICPRLAEHSFSGACSKTFGGRVNTCAKGGVMGPVNKQNGFEFCPKPNHLRRQFFKEMSRSSSSLHKVDAFVCNHPPAFCELYMPFNRSILVWVTVNLEFSRENPQRFAETVENIRRIASVPHNVVAANSRYDQEYVRYFTGVEPIYLPSYCGYVKAKYETGGSKKSTILFGRNHRNPHQYAEIQQNRPNSFKYGFERVEKAYPKGFEYTDLAKHPAVVLIPYTKSVMSFFELYRMNIPIWVPDVKLLSRWEQEERIMKERVYWSETPLPNNPKVPFSPNDLKNIQAIEHWVALSDFFTFPHIQTFSSYEDLYRQLESADFNAISQNMKSANARLLQELKETWVEIFQKMFIDPNGHYIRPGSRAVPADFDTAMLDIYGAGVPMAKLSGEPDCKRRSRPEHGVFK